MSTTITLTDEQDQALDEYVNKLISFAVEAGHENGEEGAAAGEPCATPEEMAELPDICNTIRANLRESIAPQFATMNSDEIAKRLEKATATLS
jgi:hypothetical protein